ncbi:MAG: WD40-repeat-containing domain protein, partial [Benjaminiella poitrasii]
MEEHFPVNSGNVPPPSQSSNLLTHQLNLNNATFQNTNAIRQRILGLTSTSSNILATSNDLVAYAAGAVVVIYNHKRNKQVGFLYPPPIVQSTAAANNTNIRDNNNGNIITTANNNTNQQTASIAPLITPLGGGNAPTNGMLNDEILLSAQNKSASKDEKRSSTAASNRAKPISCLTFSIDGRYLAAGEMGHQPRIFIWDVKEKKLIREFRSHKFGVLTLTFSPNGKYLVSVGFQHDGYLYVWDWKKGTKLAGNKANLSSREIQVLDGRSGILGVLRDGNFVDVACDKISNTGYTYFITDSGILCTFKEGRMLDKWVDLQVKSAYSIAMSESYIICACSEGIIRLFEPLTLKYIGILPKPHPLGIDVSSITSPEMVTRSSDEKGAAPYYYPDSLAMVYDGHKVTIAYSDRSLYVWDIHDLEKIGKYRSFIFHSDCVWGVEAFPRIEREDNTTIPLNSFATFSADGTIRFWNLDSSSHITSSSSTTPLSLPRLTENRKQLLSPSSSTTVTGLHRRNIYSRELVKMIYADPDAAEFAKLRGDFDFSDDQCPDFGIRSLKISSDGLIMASGDRNGNLRVHDLNTWELLTYLEAHDSEILSIDMTTSKNKDIPSLIATASRDRLLHIFDIKSKFQLVQSLDDHSSSITAVKFSNDASRLISCGADKGIIFRHRTYPITSYDSSTNTIPRPYATYHTYSGRSTVFDMALDVNGKYVATVTGERRLYVLGVDTGKPFRVCKPETAEEVMVGKVSENSGGSLINVDLDPYSGTYAVTSGSDRCIRLFDLINSTCIEKVCAHAELITAVKFIQTGTDEEGGLRVVSTCSDGTIFIWKVSREIVAKMRARADERDLNLKQHKAEEDTDKHAIPAFGINNPQNNKRIRRISTATPNMIHPTASISQMVRQGERNTFSTVSPAEAKYDELYKKNAVTFDNSRAGKLDRLYNGLPTTNGGRERTMSQTTLSGLSTQQQQRLQQTLNPPLAPLGASNNAQAITGRAKSNRILRRAVSRDVLLKKEQHELLKKSSAITLGSSAKQLHQESVEINKRKSSQPSFETEKRRSSAPQTEVYNDADIETSKDEEEEEDDEEDESLEEEEIIFTPEQEKTNKPFEVSLHQALSSSTTGDEEDGGQTPISSDNETNGTANKTGDEEDEGCSSSEDNVDDAINRDITAREPPRISMSLSRTTSSASMGKSVKRQSITARFLSSL